MHAIALTLVLASTSSEPVHVDFRNVHALRYDLAVDLAVTGTLWTGWILSEAAFKESLAPATCRFCDRAADGSDSLNALDRWGRGMRVEGGLDQMDMASNVVAFAVLPLLALGLDYYVASSEGAAWGAPIDWLLVAEAVGAALALNQVVKFAVGRERPFVHAMPEAEKALVHNATDNNLSFFSGHATFSFALAVGAGTVAELRGYEGAWLIWVAALPVAASVGLLRMAADKHYLTDVALGAAVGTAFGHGLPRLFHGRMRPDERPGNVRLVPAPNGLGLHVRF